LSELGQTTLFLLARDIPILDEKFDQSDKIHNFVRVNIDDDVDILFYVGADVSDFRTASIALSVASPILSFSSSISSTRRRFAMPQKSRIMALKVAPGDWCSGALD